MSRISGQSKKRKTQEIVDINDPVPSHCASINPSSESEWWENFSTRFSGYTLPDSLFKVSRKTFEYIRGLVKEEMMTGKNYTDQRRECLALNDCVAIALTRLCTGESFEAVGNLFGVNISTAYQITWRFVEAIEKKGFHHLHWPKTEDQITEIKSKFEGISGLPNCCGAIDATKIMFSLSSDDAQRRIWCDQENNPCMILQAVVDPDMRFLDISTGLPGCLSEPDALCEWSLFNLCEQGKRLNGNKLKLAESNKEIGEYIVGNGGFPLLPWLLTPYNEEKKLSGVQEDFNKRLYETRKVAKMAFERLKETWQIIQGVLWRPDKLELPRIIYACCVLHNIMIDQNDGFGMQDESFLQPVDNRPQSHQPKCKFLDKTASVQRDKLALYLSSKPPRFSGNGIESVAKKKSDAYNTPRITTPLNVTPISAVSPQHAPEEVMQSISDGEEEPLQKRRRGSGVREETEVLAPYRLPDLHNQSEEAIWKMLECTQEHLRDLAKRKADKLDSVQKTNQTLRTSRDKYKKLHTTNAKEFDELKKQLKEAQAELATLKEQVEPLQSELATVKAKLRKEKEAHNKAVKVHKTLLSKAVRDAVRNFIRGPQLIKLLEVLLPPVLSEGYILGVEDLLEVLQAAMPDIYALRHWTLFCPSEKGTYDRLIKELQNGIDIVAKAKSVGQSGKTSAA